MLPTLMAALAFFQASATISAGSQGTSVRIRVREGDSTRAADSLRAKYRSKPLVASTEQVRTAFADAEAGTLLARARAARFSQDSSLTAYEAATLQRLTIGLAFSKFGRERIAFRSENSSRVRWARGIGAQVEITGKRSAAPLFGGTTDVDIETAISPIPYFPGRDNLWIGLGTVNDAADDDEIVDPLSRGSEALYTFKTGDSVTFRLPDKSTVRLRELEVRPRRPTSQTVVGSLWFDVSTGQLVRAAFRQSEPQRPDASADSSEGPFSRMIQKALAHSAEANIDGVAIEYSLHQGRFWLPRSEVIEGHVGFGPARVPMRIEETFTYSAVNSLDSIPRMRARRPLPEVPPGRNARQYRDSVYAAREKEECASTGQRSVRTDRYNKTVPVLVMIPCDTVKLAHSPTLPPSIFDKGEAFFTDAERDALLRKAESMMPDVQFRGIMRPRIEYGFDQLRYNRVEGLSAQVDFIQKIAPGTEVRFSPRIGTADRVFNGELAFSRMNGRGTRSISVYKRLDASGDWGHPLTASAGLSAFLFGRDEGFYYRSTGAEVGGDNLFGHDLAWRAFHELESDAAARTNISLPKMLGSSGFAPQTNIAAARIRESGASLRKVATFGLDPYGFRLLSDLRLESAGGDSSYGRGALDLTVSHPLGRLLSRDFSAAITAGAGSSVGGLPVQRWWYLGGTSTVRGQPAGIMSGNSYWLTHTEVGYGAPGWRRLAFLDLGWAGDRDAWRKVGRPASGAGLGWSFMDGLIRLDVARGIYPTNQWRSALYFDAKF